jgi:hypothetical protein
MDEMDHLRLAMAINNQSLKVIQGKMRFFRTENYYKQREGFFKASKSSQWP